MVRASRIRFAVLPLSIAATALLSAGTGCRAAGAANSSSGDSLYIGVAVGLASPERYVNVFKGVQLALDELNQSRPPGSKPFALKRPADNVSSVVQLAADFRDDPQVIGVVGHTESDPTISAAAIYDDREHDGRNALVSISPTAGAGPVTLASNWVFRVCPVVEQQAMILAQYMTDSLRLKRIAIVYRNDVSGREFLRTFARTIEGARSTILERDPFAEEIAEFGLYAQRLARTKPDGIMMFANSSDVVKLERAIHALGLRPMVISTNGPSTQEVQTDLSGPRDLTDLRYLALFLPDRPLTQTGSRFVSTFRNKFGQKPDHWGALSYDAAMLIGKAAQAVGPDRSKIRDWIAGVGRSQAAYSGATGEIRFDDSRNPVGKSALVTTVSQ